MSMSDPHVAASPGVVATRWVPVDPEEEALFAVARRGLDAIRRGAEPAGSTDPAATADVVSALARVEASLRALASDMELLGRRADGLDTALEARVEAAVARMTAGLRAEIDRLATRAVPPTVPADRPQPASSVPPTRRRRLGLHPVILGLVLLALVAGSAAAIRLGPGADTMERAVGARVAQWRAALSAALSPEAEAPPVQPSAVAAESGPAPGRSAREDGQAGSGQAAFAPAAPPAPPPLSAGPASAPAVAPPVRSGSPSPRRSSRAGAP